MMEQYAIDLLSEYQTEGIPSTNRPVVNPRWREFDRRYRSLRTQLQRRQVEFAAHTLRPLADREDHQAVSQWEQRKSELRETIEHLEHELEEIKGKRQPTSHHLAWDELETADKFERLAPSRKRLLDTVKLIAYRSETALVAIVRSTLSREDDARSLVRDLFRSLADITPNIESGELRIRIHGFANPHSNRAIETLLQELNASGLNYPGTNLKLVYTLLAGSPGQKHANSISA